jgi:hypothetical protein
MDDADGEGTLNLEDYTLQNVAIINTKLASMKTVTDVNIKTLKDIFTKQPDTFITHYSKTLSSMYVLYLLQPACVLQS